MLNNPQNLPYFITWTAQKDALTLPLEEVDNDFFYAKKSKWYNLSSISYQASFGLKNTRIIKEIQKQMNEFCLASPKHIFQLKEEVSKELIKRAGGGFKCFFTQSGSEGIENALKMARQISGRKLILSQKRSYHGATMGSLAITGDWRSKEHLLPKQWTKTIPDPMQDSEGKELEAFIEKLGPQKIAGICLETITGGNGVFAPSKSWYKKLMELKKRYNFFIILDEVVCAGHRTGPFFGFQRFPTLRPDIVVTAKAMTGGYFPLGVLLIRKSFAEYYNENTLSCGLTNYGHPLGLAALKGVLKLTGVKSFQAGVTKREEILKRFLTGIKTKGLETRQFGMLAAIEVGESIKANDLFEAGLYGAIQNNTIILAPNLCGSIKELQRGLSLLGEVINEKIP